MLEKGDDKTIHNISENKRLDFEEKQNAVGFFGLLLKVAKRNPELWKQICNEKNENNRGSNNTN
jgi:prephenate dehydrogenase